MLVVWCDGVDMLVSNLVTRWLLLKSLDWISLTHLQTWGQQYDVGMMSPSKCQNIFFPLPSRMVGARDYFCGRWILANWGHPTPPHPPPQRPAIHIKGFLNFKSRFLACCQNIVRNSIKNLFSCLTSSQNLAKSSCEWLLVHLPHKIEKKPLGLGLPIVF
jgi:hypothetical protein